MVNPRIIDSNGNPGIPLGFSSGVGSGDGEGSGEGEGSGVGEGSGSGSVFCVVLMVKCLR